MKTQDVVKIFDDLDSYRKFCVQFGRVYDEKALYNIKDENWIDYEAFKEGKRIRNHWNFARSQLNKQNNNFKRNNNKNRYHTKRKNA